MDLPGAKRSAGDAPAAVAAGPAKRARPLQAEPHVIVLDPEDESPRARHAPDFADLRTPATSNAATAADDVEVLQTRRGLAQQAPHARTHCQEFPLLPRGHAGNLRHCSSCHCFCCDTLVSQCRDWQNHCHANDKAAEWKAERARQRALRNAPAAAPEDPPVLLDRRPAQPYAYAAPQPQPRPQPRPQPQPQPQPAPLFEKRPSQPYSMHPPAPAPAPPAGGAGRPAVVPTGFSASSSSRPIPPAAAAKPAPGAGFMSGRPSAPAAAASANAAPPPAGAASAGELDLAHMRARVEAARARLHAQVEEAARARLHAQEEAFLARARELGLQRAKKAAAMLVAARRGRPGPSASSSSSSAAPAASAAARPPEYQEDRNPAKYAGYIDFSVDLCTIATAKEAMKSMPPNVRLGAALELLESRIEATYPKSKWKQRAKALEHLHALEEATEPLRMYERTCLTTRCCFSVNGRILHIKAHVYFTEQIGGKRSFELAFALRSLVPCIPASPAAVGPFSQPPALPLLADLRPPAQKLCSVYPSLAVRAQALAADHELPLFHIDALLQSAVSDLRGREEADPPGLAVRLQGYQRQALAFMLDRERAPASLAEEWCLRTTLADGQRLFVDTFSGRFELEQNGASAFPQTRGGILAEEMGLGKTVELIALLLATLPSPRPAAPVPSAAPTRQQRAPSHGTLVVCPASLLGQWRRELRGKVRPESSLRVYEYHTGRTKDPVHLLGYDVVLTTYSILNRKEEGPDSPLHRIRWHRIILDEAHYIKNACATSKAVEGLAAPYKWAVTGTPIQTKIEDLRAILSFLNIAPFDSPAFFKEQIQHPYDNVRGRAAGRLWMGDAPRSEAVAYLRTLFSQCLMRHVKTQAYPDGRPLLALPARTDRTVYLDFAPHERVLYDHLYALLKPLFARIAADDAVLRRNYIAFAALLRPLRALCSDSALLGLESFLAGAHAGKGRFLDEDSGAAQAVPFEEILSWLASKLGGDVARVEALAEGLRSGAETCAVCLDAVTSPTFTSCGHVFCAGCLSDHIEAAEEEPACPTCRAPLKKKETKTVSAESLQPRGAGEEAAQGAAGQQIPEAVRQAHAVCAAEGAVSTKVAALMAALEEMRRRDATSKAVVFTQFNATLERVVGALGRGGFGHVRIDGAMAAGRCLHCAFTLKTRPAAGRRARELEKFETDPSKTVFVLSIRSGAVGLTLTRADHCFVLEPCMNAGTELQAVNRIHRLGQTRPVSITCFAMRARPVPPGHPPVPPLNPLQNTVEARILEARGAASHEQHPYPLPGSSRAARVAAEGQAGSLREDRPAARVDVWRRIFS
eukprot:tig00020800_g13750.t1